MPIYDQAIPITFSEMVGVTIPQQWDIWCSFGDPFLVTELRSELTNKGEDILTCQAHRQLSEQEIERLIWSIDVSPANEIQDNQARIERLMWDVDASSTKENKETRIAREKKRIKEVFAEALNTPRESVIDKYAKPDSDIVCVCQALPMFTFFEAQLMTKAQVKALKKNSARRWDWRYNPTLKAKMNFSHCLLWWRD